MPSRTRFECNGLPEIGVDGVHHKPRAVCAAIFTGRAIGEQTVYPMVAPSIRECVLSKIVRLLHYIWIALIVQLPSRILYDGEVAFISSRRVWLLQRGIPDLVCGQMRPERSFGTKQDPERVKVTQERHCGIVVCQASECMQTSLAIAEEPILLEHLSSRRTRLAHDYTSLLRKA